MKTIIIRKASDCYTAEQLINGKPDQSITELFGTHILPTAFTAQADMQMVMTEVQALNPDAKVVAA